MVGKMALYGGSFGAICGLIGQPQSVLILKNKNEKIYPLVMVCLFPWRI